MCDSQSLMYITEQTVQSFFRNNKQHNEIENHHLIEKIVYHIYMYTSTGRNDKHDEHFYIEITNSQNTKKPQAGLFVPVLQ